MEVEIVIISRALSAMARVDSSWPLKAHFQTSGNAHVQSSRATSVHIFPHNCNLYTQFHFKKKWKIILKKNTTKITQFFYLAKFLLYKKIIPTNLN